MSRVPTRSFVVPVLVALLLLCTLLATPPARAEAPVVGGQETDLGVQVPGRAGAIRSEQSAQGSLADGRYLTYFANSGGPGTAARFFAMDLAGDLVAEIEVPTGTDVLTVVHSPSSRSVWLAANGPDSSTLYEWTGGSSLTVRATIAGRIVMRAAVAPDGDLYLGTYAPSDGRLLRYRAGTVTDLGQPVAGESYVRSLAVDATSVWVSNYRQAGARLVEVDRQTGARRTVTVPADLASEWSALDMSRAGDLLFLRTVNSNRLFAYDTAADTFRTFDDQVARVYTSPEVENRVPYVSGISPYGISGLLQGRYVYFQRANAGIMRVDLLGGLKTVRIDRYNATDNPVSTPGASVAGPVSYAWLTGVAGRSGGSLVTTSIDGRVHVNTAGQTAPVVLSLPVTEAPSTITSLGADAGGRVYSGGFDLPSGIGLHAAGTTSLLSGPQVEGSAPFGSGMVLGGYTGTTPSGPLYRHSGTGQPQLSTYLGNDQERPVAMLQVDDRVAVGSVPVKNLRGGALSFWDPATGAVEVHRDVVPDHSVVSLARHGGFVVGGSSSAGGTGATPATTDARIFTYELATGTVRSLAAPRLAGATYTWVAAITPDPAAPGYFWAISTSYLVQFRVLADGSVVLTKNLGAFPGTSSPMGKGLGIEFVDGILFATLGGTLSAVNTDTGERTVVAPETAAGPVYDLVRGADRRLYFARGSRLYRYDVTGASSTTTLAAPAVTSPDLSGSVPPGPVVLSGTGTKNSQITVTNGARTRTTVVADGGTWAVGAIDFAAGTHRVTVSAALPGFTTRTTEVTLTVVDPSAPTSCDIEAPVPTNVVVGGYNRPDADYAFAGTGTPGTTVTMVSGTRTRSAAVRSDGTWAMSAVPFGWWAGTLPFTAARSGCTSVTNQVPLTFAVKQATHVAPTLLSHTSTQYYPSGDVAFSGKGTPGALVTLVAGGQTRYASASSTGRWHMRALTVGPAPVSLVFRSTAPEHPDRTTTFEGWFGPAATSVVAPSLTSPAAGATVSGDPLVLSGTGTPATRVSVVVGAREVRTFVRSSGRWDVSVGPVAGGPQAVRLTGWAPGLTAQSRDVTVSVS